MARLDIQSLAKRYGDFYAVRDVSLHIADGEFLVLLGPSGCGKTTTLRMVAGFIEPTGGTVRLGGTDVTLLPPWKRNAGMVFQSYALFPHLTVAQNVAFGLEMRKLPRADIEHRVEETLALVRLKGYDGRLPRQLSGGQQQRVALARALAIRPDVLLLDEPLSNLDARLRLELREEIRRIHAQTRITTLYVTHDQKEALSLADRIAVMRDGRIEQIGDPRAIYRTPANRFVADFIGETNWYPARVRTVSATAISLETEFGLFQAATKSNLAVGEKVWLGLRPESVQIGAHEVNSLKTTIAQVSYLGEIVQYGLEISPGVALKALEQNPLEIRQAGTGLLVHVRPQDLLVL